MRRTLSRLRQWLTILVVVSGAFGLAQAPAPEPLPSSAVHSAALKTGEVTLTILNIGQVQAVTMLGRFSVGVAAAPPTDRRCEVTPINYSTADSQGAAVASPRSAAQPSAAPAFLNAGPLIYLSTSQGLYLSAVKRGPVYHSVSKDADAPAFLQSIGAVLGPLPRTLEVVVPGKAGAGGFPAMRLPLPHLAPFRLTAPSDLTALQADTTLMWSGASQRSDAYVLLSLSQLGPDRGIHILCRTEDTGAFAFPEQTRQAIDEAGLQGGLLLGQILRVVSVTKVRSDAQLRVNVIEGQFDLNR